MGPEKKPRGDVPGYDRGIGQDYISPAPEDQKRPPCGRPGGGQIQGSRSDAIVFRGRK